MSYAKGEIALGAQILSELMTHFASPSLSCFHHRWPVVHLVIPSFFWDTFLVNRASLGVILLRFFIRKFN